MSRRISEGRRMFAGQFDISLQHELKHQWIKVFGMVPKTGVWLMDYPRPIIHLIRVKMSAQGYERGSGAALAETLRQLLEARQEKIADRLLDQCDRALVEKLHHSPVIGLHVRLSYVLRVRLRRRPEREGRDATGFMPALAGVLNLWCREGRRSSIRSVLRELESTDLKVLAGEKELDAEVASMLREFNV